MNEYKCTVLVRGDQAFICNVDSCFKSRAIVDAKQRAKKKLGNSIRIESVSAELINPTITPEKLDKLNDMEIKNSND